MEFTGFSLCISVSNSIVFLIAIEDTLALLDGKDLPGAMPDVCGLLEGFGASNRRLGFAWSVTARL